MASKGKDSQRTDDVSVVLVVDIEYLKKKIKINNYHRYINRRMGVIQ